MEEINIEDFAKVEFKVGEIKEAIKVEGSSKLIRMRVDFGEENMRTVFSGIQKYYEPEELVGKKTVFVTNIHPRKMMSEKSEAMIFGGETDDGEKMSLMILDKDLPNGSKVF